MKFSFERRKYSQVKRITAGLRGASISARLRPEGGGNKGVRIGLSGARWKKEKWKRDFLILYFPEYLRRNFLQLRKRSFHNFPFFLELLFTKSKSENEEGKERTCCAGLSKNASRYENRWRKADMQFPRLDSYPSKIVGGILWRISPRSSRETLAFSSSNSFNTRSSYALWYRAAINNRGYRLERRSYCSAIDICSFESDGFSRTCSSVDRSKKAASRSRRLITNFNRKFLFFIFFFFFSFARNCFLSYQNQLIYHIG